MNEIYLLTGGNLGNRLQNLQSAANLIEKSAGTILKRSSVYETAAWGFTAQPSFLNQVLCISSSLTPEELLQKLLIIEVEMGRKRMEKMGPRVIDIDILLYGDEIISTDDLMIPHPRIAERRFVLTPLNEIAAGAKHPVYQQTIQQLLLACPDNLEVNVYHSNQLRKS